MSAPTLFHRTIVAGIGELEPRRRFTPGALGAGAPPAVYATDDPAYAAAQAFPWSSAEGFNLRYDDGQLVLTVPAAHAARLAQAICVYTVPGEAFELMEGVPPRGRNYRSLGPVRPTGVATFASVREGVEYFGGRVELTDGR